MNRLVLLASGASLALIALVGCIDTIRSGDAVLAVLFGVLVVGVGALTLAAYRRSGLVLRSDLATWVERTSASTGEKPDELASRAVSRLRAGFAPVPDDE